MKILAISDIHGEENENLYKYLENNDIDLVIIHLLENSLEKYLIMIVM